MSQVEVINEERRKKHMLFVDSIIKLLVSPLFVHIYNGIDYVD